MLLIRLFGVVCCSGIGWGGIASVDESNKLTPDISGSASDTVTTSNEAVQEDDTYSMYKKLMDMREDMVERQERQESEALKMVKTALQVVLETALHSFINGFLPSVERVRREAPTEKRSYLDGVVYVAGALLGKTECSNMIACATGRFVQERMPGAQLAVMMAESVVPHSMLNFFGVVKRAVIDRSGNCESEYKCSLSEDSSSTGSSDTTTA